MKPIEHVTYPEGADQALLKRFAKKAMLVREKCFKRSHDALLRRAKAFAKRVDLNEDVTKAIADQRRLVEKLRREKPPKFVPLKGHNPARYAPFEWSSSFIDCGVPRPGDACELRGPDPTTGEIGATLYKRARLSDFSDASSAISSVGFWYYPSASGTLSVTAQAYISGLAHALYGETYAGLAVSVEAGFPSMQCPLQSITDIFRSTVTPWEDLNLFFGYLPTWEGRTVSIVTPVQRYHWYLITVSALQHVISWASSDFDMYVGPISYSLV
jgi:hypothetical protein